MRPFFDHSEILSKSAQPALHLLKLNYNIDMKTQKGYVIPAVLIVILLIIAGFVTFGMEQAKAPTIDETPLSAEPTPVILKSPSENSTTTATTTATTSIEMDIGGEPILQ